MKNIIYKITNNTNGKVYIGLTSQGLERRKSEHLHRNNRGERDHKLYLAFKKYGFENFTFETICSALKKEYLPELEILLIAQYNSYNRGYNSTIGGDSVSDETKEKIRSKMLGREILWRDKILESRAKNENDKSVKTHSIMFPDGSIHVIRNLTQFCKEHKLDPSNLYHKKGTGKRVKGYSLV